jgi:hypothetical protein
VGKIESGFSPQCSIETHLLSNIKETSCRHSGYKGTGLVCSEATGVALLYTLNSAWTGAGWIEPEETGRRLNNLAL